MHSCAIVKASVLDADSSKQLDELGCLSGESQHLNGPITSSEKLAAAGQTQTLLLCRDGASRVFEELDEQGLRVLLLHLHPRPFALYSPLGVDAAPSLVHAVATTTLDVSRNVGLVLKLLTLLQVQGKGQPAIKVSLFLALVVVRDVAMTLCFHHTALPREHLIVEIRLPP
jgi:hypothetical protein